MTQKPKIDIQALWDIEHDLMRAFGTIENVEERFNLMPGADLSRDSLHPKISCTLHKVRSQLKSSMNMLREHYPELNMREREQRDKESREWLNKHLEGRKQPEHNIMDCGIPMLDE